MPVYQMVADIEPVLLRSHQPRSETILANRIRHEWGPSDIDRLIGEARQRRTQAGQAWLRTQSQTLWIRLLVSVIAMIGLVAFAELDQPKVLPLAILAIFVAATLSSVAGFAFSAVCGALLFHLLSPVAAVQLMIVCSIAIQGLSVVALRHSIDWQVLARFLIGGIVSLPIGVYLLLALDAHIYARIMGGFLVAYGLFMLLRPKTTLGFQRIWADGLAGACGGITGGFAGFPGAFVTIWCALKGWEKDRQRGVYQPYILIMQVLSLVVISFASAGLHNPTPSLGLSSLMYVPAALLGTWCGLAWYRKLSDAQFRIVVNMLLIVAGAGLVL